MATHSSATELQSMTLADLTREIRGQAFSLEKMRLSVQLGKEKDTARFRREKRQYARMMTELGRKQRGRLQPRVKPSTVPPSTK